MEQFLINISSFPVVVFTFLLIIILCYWFMALLGVVDIDLFDLDLDMEFDSSIELDASAEGISGEGTGSEGLGAIAGFMLNWGLTGVPVTVVISLLIVTSWLICYLVVSLLFPLIPWGIIRYAIGAVLLFACFAIAIPLTAWSIRPFKGFFVTHNAVRKETLIGQECEVKTGTVTNDFGQGILEDGGAGMILDIRAEESKNIKKGDTVILIEYIAEDDSYNVTKP
jgi:hypothetical protein